MEFTKLIGLNQQKILRISWLTTGNGDIMNSSWGDSGLSISDSEKDYKVELFPALNGRAYTHVSIRLSSASAFTVVVNWGDGTEEKYDSHYTLEGNWNGGTKDEVYNKYGAAHRIIFRPQVKYPFVLAGVNSDSSYFNAPSYIVSVDVNGGDFYNGVQHTYSDNKVYTIVVTVIKGTVTIFEEYATHDMEWVYMQLPELTGSTIENTFKTSTLPFALFVFLDKLTALSFNASVSSKKKLTYLPDTLFNMKSLTSLDLSNCIDTSDEDWWNTMNMDRIAGLTNLRTLHLSSNAIKKFPKILTKKSYNLITLGTAAGGDSIVYEDVTFDNTINSICDACSSSMPLNYSGPVFYKKALTDYSQEHNVDLSNIRHYYISGYPIFPYGTRELILDLPASYDRLWGITSFYAQGIEGVSPTVERYDNMVEAVYNRTIQHPMASTEDGHRNLWYSISNYLDSNFNSANKYIPSGTYQAPTGFVLGESNGTPASAMEMIYVLTHNYALTWNITGGLPSANSISLFSEDPNDLVYSAKVYNNGKYKLSLNIEGNYIYSAPDVTTFGVMRGSTIEFDTILELANYVSQLNLYVINLSDVDADLKELNDYGVL